MPDRGSLEALRNLIKETDLLLETTAPLPENRTPRCRELLRAALALVDDTERICTSHIERQNLTIRMSMRRLTRLTNAFSKKWDNLWAAYCVHFAYYNFCRIHKTLRVTPAMETGITDRVWTLADLLA
jgi:hypothetical protein